VELTMDRLEEIVQPGAVETDETWSSDAGEARGGSDGAAGGASSPESARPGTARALVPPPPRSLEEAGLSEEFVAGLVLKTLHARGSAMGFELVDALALSMALLDDVLRQLQDRQYVEVHATKGPQRGEYVFKLTSAGRQRAVEELEVSYTTEIVSLLGVSVGFGDLDGDG